MATDDKPWLFKPGCPPGPGRPVGLLDKSQIDAKKLTATLMRVALKVVDEGELKTLLKEAMHKDVLRWWAVIGRYLPPVQELMTDAARSAQGVSAQDVITILNKIDRERRAEAKRVGAEVIE